MSTSDDLSLASRCQRDQPPILLWMGLPLSIMTAAMLVAAWLVTDDTRTGSIGGAYYGLFHIALALYIAIFMTTDLLTSGNANWKQACLVIPAAALGAWAIVIGPGLGWLLFATLTLILVASLFVGVMVFAFPVFIVGCITLAPAVAGAVVATLAYVILRLLGGVPLFNPSARRELKFQVFGFAGGAYAVYLGYFIRGRQLKNVSEVDYLGFIDLAWWLFLAAPLIHLSIVRLGRSQTGWPSYRIAPRRPMILGALVLLAMLLIAAITGGQPFWRLFDY